jgi:cysteine synthase
MKSGLLEQIGNTPLVKLERTCSDLPGVEIWVKCEFPQPGRLCERSARLQHYSRGRGQRQA